MPRENKWVNKEIKKEIGENCETHRQRMNLWLPERRILGRIVRELGIDMYTLLYLQWMMSKDLLYSTWNSTQCYVAAWMGGGFGGEWIHVYVWLSPFAVHLKLSQYC